MPAASWESLKKELRTEPPAGLRELDDAHIALLAESMRRSRKEQQKHLAAALEASLQHVPALLRGAVRKIFSL